MAFMGEMVGGAIAILLLSFVIESLIFKSEEPSQRAIKTCGLALIIASVLAGFGKADGGSFVWTAGISYLPGAIFVFLWFRSRYAAKWSDEDDVAV
jgi:Ca2+/Na+ antiporter